MEKQLEEFMGNPVKAEDEMLFNQTDVSAITRQPMEIPKPPPLYEDDLLI